MDLLSWPLPLRVLQRLGPGTQGRKGIRKESCSPIPFRSPSMLLGGGGGSGLQLERPVLFLRSRARGKESIEAGQGGEQDGRRQEGERREEEDCPLLS